MIICFGDKPTEKQKYANSGMLMPAYKFLCYTFFFYKNHVYKNVEAQILQKLRTC